MDRPKRPIIKPSRYQTTSSSDETCKKKATETSNENEKRNKTFSIEDDIGELRGVLEQNSSNNIYNNLPLPTHTYTQPHTLYPYTTCVTNTGSQIPYTYSLPTSSTYLQPQRPHQHIPLQNSVYTQPCIPHTMISTYTELIPAATCSSLINNEGDILDMNSNVHEKLNTQDTRAQRRENVEDLQPEKKNMESRKIHKRFDTLETALRNMNGTMEQILKCVQGQQNRRRTVKKPACLPICTNTEMMAFETINEDIYEEVVDYFHYVGGFTVKEAINLCFKESIKDSMTALLTWFGREGHLALYDKRIVVAIYDAVCNNRFFMKPSRTEFQSHVREALRSAKQRHRMSTRAPRFADQHLARNLWNDEAEKENETEELIQEIVQNENE